MTRSPNSPTGSPAPAPDFSRRTMIIASGAAGLSGLARPAAAEAAAGETCCPILEMRQYTLRAGHREAFVALFEQEFIETQEAVGIRVIGQFHDLDDPERFVWLRGFPDMPARANALASFYDSALWKAKRGAANASIVDSDNVLLLRRTGVGAGFAANRLKRPPRGSRAPTTSVVFASLQYLEPDKVPLFTDFFSATMKPQIEARGIPIIGQFASEPSPNNFARLPIRESDHVFVWFSAFASLSQGNQRFADLREQQTWRAGASDSILHQLERKPETLRLTPTDRSALRG